MTTAVALPTSSSVSIASLVQEIPLNRICESRTNPRRQFDETKLAELAANIRHHGVLQPVLVRPMPAGEPDAFELVAGARRYRASKLAGRETIPASIRDLTDTECLELQLIENLQRADVHELDEARGYSALMQLQPDTYTVETLAEKVGRSEKYVYARLRLLHLIDEVQQAFYLGKLTVAHAFEVARLQPEDQHRALAECFPQHRSAAAVLKDKKAEAVTVRSLREWIEREIHLDISHAPFDAQDEKLLPVAGSCAACPKRTGNNPLLFPEVRQKSICTDRACYRAKVEALVQIRVKPLEESGEKPLRVSHAPAWQEETSSGCSVRRTIPAYRQKRRVPTDEARRRGGRPRSGNHSSCVPRRKMPRACTRDAVSTIAAGTRCASERTSRRAHRKTIPRPHSRRHPQKAAGHVCAPRPRNGRARLFPQARP
jgi:ParB/RepB/Spo0J family partition protein